MSDILGSSDPGNQLNVPLFGYKRVPRQEPLDAIQDLAAFRGRTDVSTVMPNPKPIRDCSTCSEAVIQFFSNSENLRQQVQYEGGSARVCVHRALDFLVAGSVVLVRAVDGLVGVEVPGDEVGKVEVGVAVLPGLDHVVLGVAGVERLLPVQRRHGFLPVHSRVAAWGCDPVTRPRSGYVDIYPEVDGIP